jgi:hypothetical protein
MQGHTYRHDNTTCHSSFIKRNKVKHSSNNALLKKLFLLVAVMPRKGATEFSINYRI